MNNRSTKDIRVVMMPFDLLCFTIRVHHVFIMFECQQFRLPWEISCQAENEFCYETSLIKLVKIKHCLIVWKLTIEKNVKFNDAYAKGCIPKGLRTIKHASCFSCLYRENNYICNSLGKYKRTIFIERSENVNIEMCVQYILYRVSKYFTNFL